MDKNLFFTKGKKSYTQLKWSLQFVQEEEIIFTCENKILKLKT